ncbi:FAD-binding domain-containing protein [Apiospora kogelbergensis]|uniref:FAD-binding domain-containing protein n=1 Tax=Apiospora kogelbergensis TaxID=1337665 RepID=A0AAW0R1Z3_9PEZI
MAEKHTKHQVVIVGGGITGLTLALCLQHLKVDYVLLEAYGSIAPDVGASILLFPHGQRILDQLGILDKLQSAGLPQGTLDYRDGATGQSLRRSDFGDIFRRRHGYSLLWSSRHRILRALHEAVAEPQQRLLVNKRVTRIDSLPEGVLVNTDDGSAYEAQIVVGCDGVHSTVRKEIASPKRTGGDVGCEYGCFFAASKCTPVVTETVEPGAGALISLQDGQVVLGRGLDDEMYFFCTWTLPTSQQKCSIDDIPRFTKEDKERVLDRFRDVVFGDNGVRMQELFDNLIRSGVTALPHYTLRKWSSGRIIAIGDAVHKFNPVAGQGGNSCIDSCALLVNALQEHLGTDLANMPSWPLPSLSQAFEDVENASVRKVTTLVEESQNMIRLLSWRRWYDKIMYRYIVPYLPAYFLLQPHSAAIVTGVRLRGPFKQPEAKHDWLYDEERVPSKPMSL